MKLKIGLVTGEYPPHQGGVGDFTREMAHALAALGHEIHVITHQAASPSSVVLVHPAIASWNLQSLISIRRLARDLKLDLINIQYQAAAYSMTPPIHFLPLLTGIPTVVTFHDLRIPYLFPKAGALRWQALMLLAKKAAGVIVTNPEDRLTLAREQVQRVAEIPIGSNILAGVRSLEPSVRKQYGIGKDDFVVGYFGFLNSSKGGDTLIKSITQLPFANCKLLLIGGRTGTSDPTNEAYAAQLDALAKNLGIAHKIIRTGYLPPAETTQALWACDVMAMPYEDGASFRRGTFMACLAHGLPTITTQPATPLPELKHGENIWLIPPHDTTALANALQTLQRDAELRKKLSRGARELSDLFTWDKIAQRTADFFTEVVTVH